MEIECDFEELNSHFVFQPEKFYFCKVTVCNITKRGSAVASFKGVHQAQKNNNSVTALWFQDTKVHYLPRNLTQIFPNLVYLAVLKCELKEVSAEDMLGLDKLEFLNLRSNSITTLPVDLFKNMKNLKKATFNMNMIEQFDVKVLEPIRGTIEYFEMRWNAGIHEIFEKKTGIKDFIERLKLLESRKTDSEPLSDLLTTGKHSDFTIKVQDKEYKVHKCILASMSSVFDRILTDDPTATAKTFENTRNFSESGIKEFLRYFYTRTTPSKQNAIELYNLAFEFDVPKLKREAFDAVRELHPEVCEFLFDKPDVVNGIVEAKDEFQAKRIKLEKQ